FFSSRRRHTRFKCDWSSDVCSSDLPRLGSLVTLDRRRIETKIPIGKTDLATNGSRRLLIGYRNVDLSPAEPAVATLHRSGGRKRSEERRVGEGSVSGGAAEG